MYRSLAILAVVCGAVHGETVLVLPFANQAKSPDLDWIGESVAESVHDALASQGLLVLDREDRLEAFRRRSVRPGAELTHASIIKIGQSLDATQVVYGSFDVVPSEKGKDQSKGSLRMTARILDLKRLHQGPEFTEVGAIEDLALLQAHLSWQALQFLVPKSAPTEQEYMRARPPVRLDAVESYIRGLLAQNPEQRHRFFAQAARLDDHYSQPCFQLGKASWTNKDYEDAAKWLGRVNRSDPHYLEAQFLLGLCRYYNGDFTSAEQAFQLVSASVPLNEVYNDLAAAEARLNNRASAVANFQKALDGDSSDPDYHFNLGYTYWKMGKFADAVTSFRASVQRNPNDAEATALLGRALKQEGPRPGDPKFEARERLKTNYDEAAYRQLQAELQIKK